MTNPLLDFTGLPRFDQIRPDHVAPAMDDLLTRADAALDTVTEPEKHDQVFETDGAKL